MRDAWAINIIYRRLNRPVASNPAPPTLSLSLSLLGCCGFAQSGCLVRAAAPRIPIPQAVLVVVVVVVVTRASIDFQLIRCSQPRLFGVRVRAKVCAVVVDTVVAAATAALI